MNIHFWSFLLSHFSCVRLCDPTDGSPPGSPVPGILQARTLEWVAISFSNAWKWKVKVKSLSRVQLFVTPQIAAYQAPPPMEFSRQQYWSGLPLPSPFWSLIVSKEFQFVFQSSCTILFYQAFIRYILFQTSLSTLDIAWILNLHHFGCINWSSSGFNFYFHDYYWSWTSLHFFTVHSHFPLWKMPVHVFCWFFCWIVHCWIYF